MTDYTELIQKLRYCVVEGKCSKCELVNSATCSDVLMEQAADAIEDLQKQLRKSEADNVNLTGWLAEEHAKHLWVSCDERLPEKYDRVLVYSKATRMGRSIDFVNADGNWYTTPKVTHWMPLPEPPEE